MHRARSLTINTSNACLVNKFNSLNSNSGGGGRPYTPPPPSCRLHKIYEEKYEYLGVVGYDNWFDENANPFYRHAELELSSQDPDPLTDASSSTANTQDGVNSTSTNSQSADSLNKVVLLPVKPSQPSFHQKDNDTTSSNHTGFESLESDSDSDEGSDEVRSLFPGGYRFSLNDQTSIDNKEDATGYPQKSDITSRRLSNRNRIMDRGRLMPDTTVFMALPMQKEHRFIMGGSKIRALSPYPRRLYEF